MATNQLIRLDNVSIVVESLDKTISFFEEIGLNLEGRSIIEDQWAAQVTGLSTQHVGIAMMITPDSHSRIELIRFISPPPRSAPVNALGYQRIIFTVKDVDEMVARLIQHGAQLVGEVVQYENAYRLCYVRGTENLLIGLAEPLNHEK